MRPQDWRAHLHLVFARKHMLRWAAASFLDAEKNYYKIMGYRGSRDALAASFLATGVLSSFKFALTSYIRICILLYQW